MMASVPPQLRPQFGAPPHHPQYVPNGQVPGAPPQPVQLPPQQKIIEKSGVRILCIADVRGNLRSLNELAKKANADHIIHTGDFGFYDNSSLERIADKTLRHVAQYSPLLDERLKKSIQSPGGSHVPIKQLVGAEPNPLSELPLFLSGTYTLDVPVYTVWGACEDVRVLEKFRSNEYRINNLHIIDEASSRLLDVGGVKLRLLGLGGAVVMHKLFDIGEGKTTIAGGQGTMWTTLLQMGDLVDTANRVYDAAETRIFITHASPAREGLLNQLSVTLKADFSISAGLHFRYGSSYNEFSVNPSLDHYRGKLASSKASFNDVWETVKNEVLAAVQQNTAQNKLLENALAIVDKMPTSSNGGSPFGGPPANAAPGAGQVDESAFKNMWNFNLADAAFGWLVLEVENGRIGTEMRAQGFNFHHRGGKPQLPTQQQQQQQPKPTMAPTTSAAPPSTDSGPVNVSVPSIPTTNNANAPISPAVPPVGPRKQTQNQGVQQPAAPPPVPKQPTPPPPAQEESPVVKPATPRPAPSGPAADRAPTPSVAPVAPLPTAIPTATPAATPTAEKTPTSNGTSPASVPPALPKVDTPAASAQNAAPTSSQSPLEKTKQTGLYISGVNSEAEVRRIFPPEDECHIVRVEEKTSRTRAVFKFFLVYFGNMEVTKEILDKLPEDLKSGPPGQRNGKPYVKMMQDEFTPSDRISSGNRPGMNDSRWGRGPAVGGNTSESDNNMGGGYRGRGNFGGRGKSRGGYEGHPVHAKSPLSGTPQASPLTSPPPSTTKPEKPVIMNCLKVVAQRAATRSIVPRTAALSARSISTFESSDYKSPFAASGKKDTTRIPDFSKYKGGNPNSNKLFGYFMVGTMGVLSAAGAKATIQDFLVNMAASADVLAMAKVEVDLTAIPEGKNVIIKWRGKPIFIRHRTPDEIEEANAVKIESLRDPQTDAERVKQPEWLVMLGICTHLGCVPIGEAGDFGGWFCPCHGSHYDISGRIRRGPAPLNLEIPEYDFPEEGKLVIG